MRKLLKLFWAFFKIGAFTIGGGYAMLPLIQREVVDENNWLTTEEFIDILAIAEVTPGPVAVNTSTYVGYKVAGIKGAMFCTLGTILPSFTIILLIVKFFWGFRQNPIIEKVFLGIRPAVAALIFSAVYKLGKNMKFNIFIIAGAFLTVLAIMLFSISPIIIILIAAIGSIIYFKYKEKKI
ncbi:chromate transporter [Tissierella praeacuta DSM 18095]|uniref:Chromate transporter n=1 Tax=Tissierella praeacuta DSM 18095 TaxID=1123404 RepID=A0A1M4WIB7_9FIRM|nr:chromate transporter [Tissierella praeacuta]TCU79076.1 chromate transporter [Tissierella praeacuta]SHE80927.1 chromate transporter [Tissierella praeacuta DSM 18095]SUO99406.1 chromate transporter, chromate ion transporter (CHR) family [Tissierella praeacuta]